MRVLKVSCLTALPIILSSASWGDDLALGQEAYYSGDYQAALTNWQPLAEDGQAGAQFGMGLLYGNGFGVALDDDLALKWYLLAAEQGHAEAQCNIAVMYANGWGVPQDNDEAFRWYSLSAAQGTVPAQVSLAKMYAGGYGAEKDNVQALKWFTIASSLGDNLPTARRDDVARAMSDEELTEAALLATAWIDGHQELLADQQ